MSNQDDTAKLGAWLREAITRLGAAATQGEITSYIQTHHAAEIAASPTLSGALDPTGGILAVVRRQYAEGEIDDETLGGYLEALRDVDAEFTKEDAAEEMARKRRDPPRQHH